MTINVGALTKVDNADVNKRLKKWRIMSHDAGRFYLYIQYDFNVYILSQNYFACENWLTDYFNDPKECWL